MTTDAQMQDALAFVDALQQEERVEITPPTPPSGTPYVELPVGKFDPTTGTLVDKAEVRELNGFDEEAISKTKTRSMALSVALDRAVVAIGDSPVTKRDLQMLTIGDRMELLLAIRTETWGDEVDLYLKCPVCREDEKVTISLANDVARRLLPDKVGGRQTQMELPSGRHALMNWPSGVVHTQILNGTIETAADLTTAVIADCVTEIDGFPMVTDQVARSLGLRDRKALYDHLMENMPGPTLSETKVTCPNCGEEINPGLTLGVLFPF